MDLPQIRMMANESIQLDRVFEDFYQRQSDYRYDNVTEFSPVDIYKRPPLSEILRQVEQTFLLTETGFQLAKLWLVESLEEDVDSDELPFIPHIDYRRFLKVIIYVDDVSEANGPFSALSINPDDYEQFRLSLKPDYKLDKKNQIAQFILSDYKSFTGPKGAMILFDTNCPHFAGAVSPGSRRRVFRFDYELPEWKRKEGLFLKLKDVVSRILS